MLVFLGGIRVERLAEFPGADCRVFRSKSLLGRETASMELYVEADE